MLRGRRNIIKEKITIWEGGEGGGGGGGGGEEENQLKLGGVGSSWRQLPTIKLYPKVDLLRSKTNLNIFWTIPEQLPKSFLDSKMVKLAEPVLVKVSIFVEFSTMKTPNSDFKVLKLDLIGTVSVHYKYMENYKIRKVEFKWPKVWIGKYGQPPKGGSGTGIGTGTSTSDFLVFDDNGIGSCNGDKTVI